MSRFLGPAARGNLSLAVSLLALLVAMSGTAYAVANGSITTRHLANGAVTSLKIAPNAVSGSKVADGSLRGTDLADGSVGSADVADRSLRLADLGGSETLRTTVVGSAVSIAAGDCREIFLTLFNPAPNGILGSLVVGTITSPGGGAVVSNTGSVVPTLVTATSQGGAIPNLLVCAGSSSQTVPAGSVVTWSLVAP